VSSNRVPYKRHNINEKIGEEGNYINRQKEKSSIQKYNFERQKI
jgi:hypothetical protein